MFFRGPPKKTEVSQVAVAYSAIPRGDLIGKRGFFAYTGLGDDGFDGYIKPARDSIRTPVNSGIVHQAEHGVMKG